MTAHPSLYRYEIFSRLPAIGMAFEVVNSDFRQKHIGQAFANRAWIGAALVPYGREGAILIKRGSFRDYPVDLSGNRLPSVGAGAIVAVSDSSDLIVNFFSF